MRTPRRSLFALAAAGAVAAACSDQPTPTPSEPTPPRVNVPGRINAAWLPTTCNLTALKENARAYTDKGNDALHTIIGQLQTELSKGRLGNVTVKAFDALARIAEIRGTSAQDPDVTAVQFDGLVKALLGCMEPAVTANALEPNPPGETSDTPDFGLALGSNWVFEVRGGAGDPPGGAYQRTKDPNPTQWWVLEPGASDWATSIGGSLKLDRVFIYGYQTTSIAFPAGVGSSFDHLTIPRITPPPANNPAFSMSVDIGLCTDDVTGSARLNHDNVFVPLETDFDCTTPPAQIAPGSSGYAFGGALNPLALARRAAGLFMPEPLYAAAFLRVVGGSRDYLSPSSVYDLSLLELSGLGTVADGKNSDPLHLTSGLNDAIEITVTEVGTGDPGPDGTPVTVSIVGNSSTIAFFKDGDAKASATVTRYVKDGVALFDNVFLTKAGGYQLGFQIAFDGFAGSMLLSNSFNMQNK